MERIMFKSIAIEVVQALCSRIKWVIGGSDFLGNFPIKL
jgi:hypothetical protein